MRLPISEQVAVAQGARPAELPTLLLVEDSNALRDLLATFLRHEGYAVHSWRNAEEAIASPLGYLGNVELLITDVFLEHLTGHDLARRLRASMPGLPVLFISGSVGPQLEPHVANSLYLEKPFSLQSLTSAIRTLIAPPRPRLELLPSPVI